MNKKDKVFFQQKIMDKMESILDNLFVEDGSVMNSEDGESHVCTVCEKKLKLCKGNSDFKCEDSIKGNTELYELERSLQRLSRGTYGFCVYCDEMISKKTLEKNLTSLFCDECSTNQPLADKYKN